MLTKGDVAYNLFKDGMNCCQAVICAFEKELKLDRETLLKLGSSFGAGFSGYREVCGAVSGIAIVVGLIEGYTDLTDITLKKQHYENVRVLLDKFKEANGSIICRELLSGEFANKPAASSRTSEYYKKRPCTELVKQAAEIVEQYLGDRNVEKRKYTFEELVEIVKTLRAPGGCPWDAEQTNESIKQALIEEAYEALEALDKGQDDKFYDELGDVLLQVVFHSQIASEQNRFDVSDVITAICTKMITRHPHVFGNASNVDTAEKVLENWENIKKKEKGLKSQTQVMKDVPNNLPALIRAYKIQQKAAKVGFDWTNIDDVFAKIKEEADELQAAIASGDKQNIEEEVGDLLFSVTNVARHIHVQPEMALHASNEKFIERFKYVEDRVKANGQRMEDLTLAELDKYWEEAK